MESTENRAEAKPNGTRVLPRAVGRDAMNEEINRALRYIYRAYDGDLGAFLKEALAKEQERANRRHRTTQP